VIDQAFRGDSVWIEANALPYAEGLYFYQIISASGRTYAGKLVRMR